MIFLRKFSLSTLLPAQNMSGSRAARRMGEEENVIERERLREKEREKERERLRERERERERREPEAAKKREGGGGIEK